METDGLTGVTRLGLGGMGRDRVGEGWGGITEGIYYRLRAISQPIAS